MHLFLTGKVQIGKSTVIKKALQQFHLKIGGFKSLGSSQDEYDKSEVYLLSVYQNENDFSPTNKIAERDHRQQVFSVYPEIFDTLGCKLLKEAGDCDLILMDELGFMESQSALFQKAVMDCLDGIIPVLGVIKPMDVPFLNGVRRHPAVKIMEVTKDNRDELPAQVVAYLKFVLKQNF